MITQKCDECGENTQINEMTEHYDAGCQNEKGLFCLICIRKIQLDDAIELRKAKENIRVHS